MNSRTRPRVIANFAVTADGKISTRNSTPTGFTSRRDLERLREIRSLGDAVMVGRKTLEVDRMSMALPIERLRQRRIDRGQAPEPLRVVVSSTGQLDLESKFATTPGAPRLLFVIGESRQPLPDYRPAVSVIPVPSLEDALLHLWEVFQVRTVVCEGGPGLFRSLVELDAVDDLYVTRAPVVFGGYEAPTLTGLPGAFFQFIRRAKLVSMKTVNREAYLHYKFSSSDLE